MKHIFLSRIGNFFIFTFLVYYVFADSYMFVLIHYHLASKLWLVEKKDRFLFYFNSYLKFLWCIGHDENKNHEQHKEDLLEDSSDDESNNSSSKTNDNITLPKNDKVLYFLLWFIGVLCLGEGAWSKINMLFKLAVLVLSSPLTLFFVVLAAPSL